jgi:DNA processing protein
VAADPETTALVALLRLGGRTQHDCVNLVRRAGSAGEALNQVLASDGAQTSLFAVDASPLLITAAASVEAWTANGIRLVTELDSVYPANLREVSDRPAIVFVSGTITLADRRSVAVIGSRQASLEGRALAGQISAELLDAGYTVVSGLAAGIDTAAHEAALEHSGRTIAVIGNGLEHSYPPENAGLQRRIASEGAVLSQFWPETRPTRQTFPMRNAVMSGVSRGSLIVEASQRSGARVQARQALAHGRPVLLHKRLLEQAWARELAGRAGVWVVGSAGDVIGILEASGGDERARE